VVAVTVVLAVLNTVAWVVRWHTAAGREERERETDMISKRKGRE
jgi:hypothetical protein